jgi:hypothetical protein
MQRALWFWRSRHAGELTAPQVARGDQALAVALAAAHPNASEKPDRERYAIARSAIQRAARADNLYDQMKALRPTLEGQPLASVLDELFFAVPD